MLKVTKFRLSIDVRSVWLKNIAMRIDMRMERGSLQ